MLNWISDFWCRNLHTKAMWPIHGRYICPQCLRERQVAWEVVPQAGEYADPSLRKSRVSNDSAVSMVQ